MVSSTALYWIVFIGTAVLSWIVQNNLKNKFEKYSKVRGYTGLTGKQTAEKMLADFGITNVTVCCIKGQLADHYNPVDHTLNLSEGVYQSNSIMAQAVAAHECGHAVQHAVSYGPLTLRSKMVPIVNISSNLMTWILLGGMLVLNYTGNNTILGCGIVLFAATTLFAFITLPVEVDASRRAITWLDQRGMTDASTHDYAVSALKAAAYTYVVAAVSSLATLLYYIMIFMSGSRRR